MSGKASASSLLRKQFTEYDRTASDKIVSTVVQAYGYAVKFTCHHPNGTELSALSRCTMRKKVNTSCRPLSLFIIYFIAAFAAWMLLEKSSTTTIMGDEPHYLVMANGIAKYKTLEQTRPYQEEFETRSIFKPGLAPLNAQPSPDNTHAVQGPQGLYNVHNIGLPAILALPYSLAGITGARAFMVVLSALVLLVIWNITGLLSNEKTHRYWTTLAVCLSLPLIPGSSQIYPDILAGMLSLTGIYWFMTANKSRVSYQEIALSALIAFLPWLQIKFSLPSALILSAVMLKQLMNRQYSSVLRTLIVSLISCAALLVYNKYAFGKITGPYQSDAIEFSKTSVMVLVGLILDQNQGLLFQNPINLIGLLAIGAVYRYDKTVAGLTLLVFAALLVPNAMHPNWYGGGSFSGRFEWAANIVFILPIAYGLLALAKSREKIFGLIVISSLVLQSYFFYIYAVTGAVIYNKITSSWPNHYSIYYTSIESWLPMLYNSAWAFRYGTNYAWFLLAAVFLYIGFKPEKQLKSVLWPAAAVIFIAGFLPNPQTNSTTFYGKDLPSLTGRVADFDRVAEPGIDTAGFLTFGPYFPLQKGSYEVLLKYSSAALPDQTVGHYEVVDSTADAKILNGPLYGTEGHRRDFRIGFTLSNERAHAFEFRNLWEGRHGIKLHALVIRQTQ